MKTGTVKEYDQSKGFGFIESEEGEDLFVHVSGLRVDLKEQGLRQGLRVQFDVQYDVKGDRAINVKSAN
ncbi:MAG: cold shock domain-containing protein [Dehalococcoidia bacterium]|nr:cold shock domain-containing protein [Dehalococcoidia bacterium]|tara:strand:- start:674 stop:880 length:207 start_codon:yes stop_codon:yes gene_type:complete